jgi:uncharacterized membrane protein
MENLIARFHLHPIIDHFTIALLGAGVIADLLASTIPSRMCDRSQFLRGLRERLMGTAVHLLVGGALAAVLSWFTGERDAERLWDTMSPAAQRLLWADTGSEWFLSHALLGRYLMYAFVMLAVWRVLQELSRAVSGTRAVYLLVATIATGALLYQGKTGGELVYDHGVGQTQHAASIFRFAAERELVPQTCWRWAQTNANSDQR